MERRVRQVCPERGFARQPHVPMPKTKPGEFVEDSDAPLRHVKPFPLEQFEVVEQPDATCGVNS